MPQLVKIRVLETINGEQVWLDLQEPQPTTVLSALVLADNVTDDSQIVGVWWGDNLERIRVEGHWYAPVR